ncbi:MAG: MCE family protein, partial [Acidimicrobiales bacterium]|nr:MCE family protein [Acidimicrobiales bacterium]
MINWRIRINLVAFLVGSLILTGFGIKNFLGNPFNPPIMVSSTFPDSSGLFPSFSVTLNGVDVGYVKKVYLTSSGAKVTMAINPGTTIPSNVVATIGIANALGEQEVDLTAVSSKSAPPLENGATIPVGPDSTPAEIGVLVHEATQILNHIPRGQLNSLLQQLSIAISNHEYDIRSIIENSQIFSAEFLSYESQFKAFLDNAPPVLNAVSDSGPALQNSLANTAALLQLLSSHKYSVVSLLKNGASATSLLNSLVVATRPNLACLTHDLGAIMSNLSTEPNYSN